MNALDSSPLEALAFNYMSYDILNVIINNIWTWVAVITAGAISYFWKIKASSASVQTDPACFCNQDSSKIAAPSSRSDGVVAELPSSTVVPAARVVESTDGVRRGKFMVYFYEEKENVCHGGEECEGDYSDVDGDGELDGHAELRWLNRWEMGWYRYQDLTVLDGNVVKLWDSRRKINT